MKKPQLKATSLRTVMVIFITLIVVILVGGFYFAQSWLNNRAANSNINSPGPTTITSSPTSLNQPNNESPGQTAASSKAAKVVASKQDYQTKIQQDLNRYASSTGLKIKDYGSTQPPNTNVTTTLVNGVQSSFVKVTIENPISYINLIKFIKAIETNLPKMKLTGINLSQPSDTGDTVNVAPLTIELYTR